MSPMVTQPGMAMPGIQMNPYGGVQAGMQGGMQGGIPPGMQGNMPQGMQGNMPQGMQGNIPQSMQGNIPQSMQGNIPTGMQGSVPGAMQGAIPSGMQGGAQAVQGVGGILRDPTNPNNATAEGPNVWMIATISLSVLIIIGAIALFVFYRMRLANRVADQTSTRRTDKKRASGRQPSPGWSGDERRGSVGQ